MLILNFEGIEVPIDSIEDLDRIADNMGKIIGVKLVVNKRDDIYWFELDKQHTLPDYEVKEIIYV